jgi:guanylate kinase
VAQGEHPRGRPDTGGAGQPGPHRLTVLAGPMAAGRGTVAADVRARYPEVWLSVPVTTRPLRPGEVSGEQYHTVPEERFDRMVAGAELLEWAVVHGRHRYGTPRRAVEEALREGRPALLEIDLRGARQVRRSLPAALVVLLAPPSREELVRQLVGRDDRRSAGAGAQRAAAPEFDLTIVDDDVHRAADELVHWMGLVPRPLGVARG